MAAQSLLAFTYTNVLHYMRLESILSPHPEPFQGGASFVDHFVICVSCLSCCLFCSLQPCGHLLEKGLPLGSLVCDVFLYFVTFQCGVLGL